MRRSGASEKTQVVVCMSETLLGGGAEKPGVLSMSGCKSDHWWI